MAEVQEINLSQRGNMAEGEGGKGGLIKIIIIVVVALVLLGGGGIAAFIFLSGGDDIDEATVADAAREVSGGGICPSDELSYLELGSFVVNLVDGRRYLKTNIELMLCDEDVGAVKGYLEMRLSEIKDLMVSELQTLSTEQLREPRERVLMRQRLLRRIESLLPNKDRDWTDPNPIKKVLITEFYLQ